MARRPTDTVTFLFTDIEGSTRLLLQLGSQYADVLRLHHAVIRRAVRDRGGMEVKTEGDSFFVVFRTPRDGVAAAVDAQRGLAGSRWPQGVEVRVR